jgi:hypothetical protein
LHARAGRRAPPSTRAAAAQSFDCCRLVFMASKPPDEGGQLFDAKSNEVLATLRRSVSSLNPSMKRRYTAAIVLGGIH